jgi:hypothetical protein
VGAAAYDRVGVIPTFSVGNGTPGPAGASTRGGSRWDAAKLPATVALGRFLQLATYTLRAMAIVRSHGAR